ncbi:GNAT family N-acetyltransferase [Pseudoxanthomonas putridarboris]|uniref:GNAT family N-acetyltransferase n=1 Tax=Pseudoxanthomonas putridarboris TaxID=752605 RepID=UPI003CE55DEE
MIARVLTPADARLYINLRRRQAKEEPDSVTIDVKSELEGLSNENPSAAIFPADPARIYWGVEHHAAIVGLLAITRRFDATLHSYLWLWGMYVRPRYRGTGVSRALMEAALLWSDGEPKQSRLFSSFPAQNRRAYQLLQRWGFSPVSQSRPSVSRVPSDYTVVERLRR